MYNRSPYNRTPYNRNVRQKLEEAQKVIDSGDPRLGNPVDADTIDSLNTIKDKTVNITINININTSPPEKVTKLEAVKFLMDVIQFILTLSSQTSQITALFSHAVNLLTKLVESFN